VARDFWRRFRGVGWAGTLRTVAGVGGTLRTVAGVGGTLRTAGCWASERRVVLVVRGMVESKVTRRGECRRKGLGLLGWTLRRTAVSVFNRATVLGLRGARLLAGAGCFKA